MCPHCGSEMKLITLTIDQQRESKHPAGSIECALPGLSVSVPIEPRVRPPPEYLLHLPDRAIILASKNWVQCRVCNLSLVMR